MNLKTASLAIIAAGGMLGASQATAGGKNVYFQVGWSNGYGNHVTISNQPHYGHGGQTYQPVTYARPVRHVKPVRYVRKHRKHMRSHWKPRQRHHWRGQGHHRGHKVAHRKHHRGYNRW